MRDILFRGKRTDNYVNDKSIDYAEKGAGEWVYGDIIHRRYYKNTDVVVIRTEDSGFDNYSDYEVDPKTVGQFTGLTDKNGKKIFEGDIATTLPTEDKNLVVRFDGGGFCLDGLLLRYYRCFGKMAVKVIGNIHDNPELLEV